MVIAASARSRRSCQAFEQFGDDERGPVGAPDVKDRQDVRMVQRRRRVRLLLKPPGSDQKKVRRGAARIGLPAQSVYRGEKDSRSG